MAEGLKQIDRLYQARRYEDAWWLAYELEQALREVSHLTGDDAMAEDANLMQRYQGVLAEQIGSAGGQLPVPEGTSRPCRGCPVTPVPAAPVLEVK